VGDDVGVCEASLKEALPLGSGLSPLPGSVGGPDGDFGDVEEGGDDEGEDEGGVPAWFGVGSESGSGFEGKIGGGEEEGPLSPSPLPPVLLSGDGEEVTGADCGLPIRLPNRSRLAREGGGNLLIWDRPGALEAEAGLKLRIARQVPTRRTKPNLRLGYDVCDMG